MLVVASGKGSAYGGVMEIIHGRIQPSPVTPAVLSTIMVTRNHVPITIDQRYTKRRPRIFVIYIFILLCGSPFGREGTCLTQKIKFANQHGFFQALTIVADADLFYYQYKSQYWIQYYLSMPRKVKYQQKTYTDLMKIGYDFEPIILIHKNNLIFINTSYFVLN